MHENVFSLFNPVLSWLLLFTRYLENILMFVSLKWNSFWNLTNKQLTFFLGLLMHVLRSCLSLMKCYFESYIIEYDCYLALVVLKIEIPCMFFMICCFLLFVLIQTCVNIAI
jgi:hypothetical protein